jgi:hypothetical protein
MQSQVSYQLSAVSVQLGRQDRFSMPYDAATRHSGAMTAITIGSEEHKELFCREFIDTHDPYDPEHMPWPELDDASVQRLRAMPFWEEAISTENDVAVKIEALVPLQSDPLLRQAIELQGFEEARHARLLREMLRHYDIAEPTVKAEKQHPDPEWNFLRVGYGECFDSFFAFGLFRLAGEVRLFPEPLLNVLEPIVREEARHILFFVNWVAYCRARRPWYRRPQHAAQCAAAMALQVWTRIKTAIAAARGGAGDEEDDFMIGVQESLALDMSPRHVAQTCLRENDARLAAYDKRLLRPRFVPALARLLVPLLPG